MLYSFNKDENRWIGVRNEKGFSALAIDPVGRPLVVDMERNLERLVNGKWEFMSARVQSVSVGANGEIFVTGGKSRADGYSMKKLVDDDRGWEKVSGAAVKVVVDPKGRPWVLNNKGELYRYQLISAWQSQQASNWLRLAGRASDIAVGSDGSVYAVDRGSILEWSEEKMNWEKSSATVF